MQKKAAFKTLGCRLNQMETDALVTDFTKAGYEVVPFGDKADVYIVNTCTVTNQSDQKSKNTINKAVRHGNENGVVVVTGCMATSQKEALEKRDDLTFVVENKQKKSVLKIVESYYKGETIQPEDIKADLFNFTVVEKGFHTRSMIKVQDGCNNHCTFCIVPKVRGRGNSRPYTEIEDNIKKVLQLGYKEIVLTGVNISRYHYNNQRFEDIVEKILEIPGDFRVRISSIEPEGFTDKFIELFYHPKMSPHLHMCLQSGSPSVLKRMRRFYSLEEYIALIERFRTIDPLFNFTTDIIVGFPGETEQEFEESLEIIKQLKFSHIHTFKYSVRKGTLAETLPNHVNEKLKTERSEVVRKLVEELKLDYRSQFIGKEQILLTESKVVDGLRRGYSEYYVPLAIDELKVEQNQFYKVKLQEIMHGSEPVLRADI